MKRQDIDNEAGYRVWLADTGSWQGTAWDELPPQAVLIEPAEAELFDETDAVSYLREFNGLILKLGKRTWAVAVSREDEQRFDCRPGKEVSNWDFLRFDDKEASSAKDDATTEGA